MKLPRLAALVALVSIALPTRGLAQTFNRSQRPAAEPPAPFAFPKMDTTRLSNLVRIVVIEDHSLPLVAVRAVVNVDSLDDPTGKEGLYALTSAMLSEGTTTRSAEQLASDIARLGNAVTPTRFTTIPQNLAPSLEIMADMLMHPTFPDSALPRLKATLAATKQRDLQIPSTVPNYVYLSRLYDASHQIARAVHATPASIASITRDDVKAFHSFFYRPNELTLVVVGDVRTADVVALVTKAFGSWSRSGEGRDVVRQPMHVVSPTTIYLIDRPGAPQSYMFVGTLGPPRSSNDFAALETMAPILGSSVGSRLLDNLRERHAYIYAGTPLAVIWRPAWFRSVIGGSAAVATAKTDSALIEWLGELRGMTQRPPTVQEMALARGWLVDALPSQFETDDLVANRLMIMMQTGVPLDFYNSYARRIEAVTPADVRAAAAKYIDLSHLVIVVAGDRKVVEPLLRAANIAPIVFVDDAGKS